MSWMISIFGGGGVFVAVVAGVFKLLEARMGQRGGRRAGKRAGLKDVAGAVESLRATAAANGKNIEALVAAQCVLLQAWIRRGALEYIAAGEVRYDEKSGLKEMHKIYKSGLAGDGELDDLMAGLDQVKVKYD